MPKLIVQLVTWNGAKYIPYLFDSLRKQTATDWELHIFDNGSTDGTADAIRAALDAGMSCEYTFEQSKDNIGFAGGHNMIFQSTSSKDTEASEYTLLLNQDMYLTQDCIADMLTYMEANDHVAAVSPRLMRWDFESLAAKRSNLRDSFTDYIDALGLKVFRSRRVVEWMTATKWSSVADQFASDTLDVFGVSGAFPMYRRSALDAVAFTDGTFLDSTYNSYKEDVDLAYRLRSAGHSSVVLLSTLSYHDRSAAGPKSLADKAAIKNKRTQSKWIKYHSYKNHIATLVKNEYVTNLLRDLPWIALYELKKFVWYLLFDRKILLGLKEVSWKKMLRRRIQIFKNKKVSAKTLRIWWT